MGPLEPICSRGHSAASATENTVHNVTTATTRRLRDILARGQKEEEDEESLRRRVFVGDMETIFQVMQLPRERRRSRKGARKGRQKEV